MNREREYDFITDIVIEAPLKTVWDALIAIPEWKKWWRAVKRLETEGDVVHLTIGYFIYRLSFDITTGKTDLGRSAEFTSDGDLSGEGKFIVREHKGVTKVDFVWNVRTTKAWMNILAPIGKPFFIYSHNLVMRWFAEGLAEHVRGKLLSHETKIKN